MTISGDIFIDEEYSSVTDIAINGFRNSQIHSLDFSRSRIQRIRDYAFKNTRNLSEIKFPETLTTIYQYAFENSAITSFNLPSSIKTISSWACLESCTNLIKFTVKQPNTYYKVEDNCLIEISTNKLIRARSDITVFELNVSSIATSAFSNTNLEKFVSTEHLTSIDKFGFIASRFLKYIDFTINNFTEFPKRCFYLCYSLRSVTIPSSVNNISSYNFASCPNLRRVIYLGSTNLSDIDIFDNPSLVKVYVFRFYPSNFFGKSKVRFILYADLCICGVNTFFNNNYSCILNSISSSLFFAFLLD